MRWFRLLALSLILVPFQLLAQSKDPGDYPLRIHVFRRDQTTFYRNRYAEEAKGEGRANLFESGEAHGVDFSFDCSEKLKPSLGFDTYLAKWKKKGQELTVLLPVFGKTGKYSTCTFKTDVKDFAYVAHNGALGSEPAADFKAWMVKHDYDPEHGKNEPVRVKSDPSTEASKE